MLEETTDSHAGNPAGEAGDDRPAATIPQAFMAENAHSDDMPDPNRRRTEGYVIDCDSKQAVILAEVDPKVEFMENYWSVGQLISVWVGENRVIGQTWKVSTPDPEWEREGHNFVLVHIEFVGEVTQSESGARFSTGITGFPQMGCVAHRIRSSDLAAIYRNDGESTVQIGHLTQDASIPAKIDIEKLLSRHFAVVGSTGVGKSTSVSLMLRKVVDARPDLRIIMLDPHNEFASAFPHNSQVITAKELQLPFWLFGLAEFSEVVFRGQDGLDAEKELLRDLVVLAKQRYQEGDSGGPSIVRRNNSGKSRISADTPVPYRIPDLIKVIDERIGQLDGKAEKPHLKSLRDRIETISADARFRFMFDPAFCGGDRLSSVVSNLFRVPIDGKPICVVEMSGLPSEVVSSVVSVICRMAFDLAISSQGGIETLVVCEEAHRYIPADPNAGFWPTRMAIGRIAKEGRKYGVYLGIITQRPSELDPTIISQCNTYFAMRLSNRRDQEMIAGAFNSGAQSTISFLPSIANRECIAFGEAIYSPMRMTFETVQAKDLPGAAIRENQDATRAGKGIDLDTVLAKMRGQAEEIPSGEDDLAAIAAQPGVAQREMQVPPTAGMPHGAGGQGVPAASGGPAMRGQGFQQQPADGPHLRGRGFQQQPADGPHLRGQGFAAHQPPAPAGHAAYAPARPHLSSHPAGAAAGPAPIQQRYQEISRQAPPPDTGSRSNAGNALLRNFRGK